MDSIKPYRVTCLDCGGDRGIKIHKTPMGDRIDWLEDQSTGRADTDKIISGRKRLDDQFGFQCFCGNNDLFTAQEEKTFSNPASPKPQEISDIVKNLQVQKSKFNLVEL